MAVKNIHNKDYKTMETGARLAIRVHDYDDNGVCIHCDHDGADHAWQMMVLRAEVGEDEFQSRRQDNKPPQCVEREKL